MLFKTQFSFKNDVLFVFACSKQQRSTGTNYNIHFNHIIHTMHMFSFVPIHYVCVCILNIYGNNNKNRHLRMNK